MANIGYVTLLPRIAGGDSGLGAAVQRLALTATGTTSVRSASGAVVRQEPRATGQVRALGFGASGAVKLERRTVVMRAGERAVVQLEARTARGQARGAVTGAAVREAYRVKSVTGFPRFEARRSFGTASSVAAETYLTAVMNAKNAAITEYSAHEFNSYAKIGSEYYAAGPDGVFLLDGSTDDGNNIDWRVLTGQMDGKDPGLKRLPEVLLGLRNTGQVRVSIHPDDNTEYAYMLPAVKLDTLHQHRVVPGKGMRSRYYAVELEGVNNSKVEIDSMQVNMTPTTRRLG